MWKQDENQGRKYSGHGMANTYVEICGQCNIEQQMCTSLGGVKNACELFWRLHTVGVCELCATLNMHPLPEKCYHQIGKEIQEKGIEEMKRAMVMRCAKLHDILRERGDEVKEIRVSCGFISMYGFVSVIELTTSICVDFVLLSKYCKVCENLGLVSKLLSTNAQKTTMEVLLPWKWKDGGACGKDQLKSAN